LILVNADGELVPRADQAQRFAAAAAANSMMLCRLRPQGTQEGA